MARPRAVAQRALVLTRDLLRQCQAQAAAFGAAADQRQEQVLGQLLGYAAAVVDDFHPQRHGMQMIVDARAMLDPRAQDDAGRASLVGIADEVPHRLGQPIGVTGQLRQAGVVVALQTHRPPAFGFGQPQYPLQHRMDIQRPVRTLRRWRKQLFQQSVETFDLRFDQADQFAFVVVIGAMAGAPGQQLRRALQAGQRIAKFMGQSFQRRTERAG
jgi:hypothetical protein